jgi:uncharacterized protein (DUF2249 family)
MGKENYAVRHPNQLKYLKAPSWEQIEKVVQAHGVVGQQFERFYGLSPNQLAKCKRGDKQLPTKHWHIIYECLRMIDDGKPMPIYKDEQPQPPESTFNIRIPSFSFSQKKKAPKRKTIKRTGSLCELC